MHFIGVLFGADESLLDHYYEGLEVEEYISYSKEEIIAQYIDLRKSAIKWRRDKIKANDPKSSEYQQWINENPRYNKRTAWNAIKKDYEGSIDSNGNILSTCNPNAQWDWYVIGGRWSKYFPSKETDSEGNTIYYDEITIGEVDWDKYFEERKFPYCYITEEGEWEARGDIGWFSSSNDKEDDAWQKEFKEELNKYPKNLPIMAIDFHI